MFRRKGPKTEPHPTGEIEARLEKFKRVYEISTVTCVLGKIYSSSFDFVLDEHKPQASVVVGYNNFFDAEFTLMPSGRERNIRFDPSMSTCSNRVNVDLAENEFMRLIEFLRTKPSNSTVIAHFDYENDPPQVRDNYFLKRTASGAWFRLVEDIADARYYRENPYSFTDR